MRLSMGDAVEGEAILMQGRDCLERPHIPGGAGDGNFPTWQARLQARCKIKLTLHTMPRT